MMEKQVVDWQGHYHRCEQEFKTLQAAKHAADIELELLKCIQIIKLSLKLNHFFVSLYILILTKLL